MIHNLVYTLLLIGHYLLWDDLGLAVGLVMVASILFFTNGLRLKWFESLLTYWGSAVALYYGCGHSIQQWLYPYRYHLERSLHQPKLLCLPLAQSLALSGLAVLAIFLAGLRRSKSPPVLPILLPMKRLLP